MLTPWSAQADFYQIFFGQQFPCHCIGCMFFQCALYWRALLTRFMILYAGGYFSNKRAIDNPVWGMRALLARFIDALYDPVCWFCSGDDCYCKS